MDFVLVDDGLGASHMRQQLAADALCGVKVGNFNTLLDTLADLWLLPQPEDEWHNQLQHHALQQDKAFWAESIRVDEPSTLGQLNASLRFLLSYLPLNERLQPLPHPASRHQHYYNDLVTLHKAMHYQRPPEQELATHWLNQAKAPSLDTLTLHRCMEDAALLPWQREVIEALHHLGPVETNKALSERLATITQAGDDQTSVLTRFTQGLFDPTHPSPLANAQGALHWLACRDAVEEVEVITAMVQQALAQGTPPEQIAILYPHGTDYPLWLEQSLGHAGILLSNVRASDAVFDWQLALLRDLIDCHSPAASPMAWMSVLTNPLMPWSAVKGHYFAERFAAGALKPDEHKAEYPLLGYLFEEVAKDPAGLLAWLGEVVSHTRARNRFGLTEHRLQQYLIELGELFSLYQALPFEEQLLRVLTQLQPGSLPLAKDKERLLHAVTMFSDRETLPFAVNQLFVLGFNQGNYAYRPSQSGVLPRHTLDEMADSLPMTLPSIAQEQGQWQARFRQLMARAKQGITFTLSRHAYDGSPLAPSESLLDMALCIQGKDKLKPEQLIVHCHESSHPLLGYREADTPEAPEVLLGDLHFERDILLAIETLHGKRRGESPSSLETLMTSPLAWLLNRLGLESRVWASLTLDVMLQGTIAHKVFELYQAHQHMPFSEDLLDKLFAQAVDEGAPFLNQAQWRLERIQLRQQVAKALSPFIQWCQGQGWHISQVEEHLKGELWDWTVRGYADAILTKKDAILILDYKKSSSKDRVTRLKAGYDLQTWIYRELYQQMHGKQSLHSGYYNLNDTTLVLDDPKLQGDPIGTELRVAVPGVSIEQQSTLAREQITERFRQIRQGSIPLNEQSDTALWQPLGIKLYALESNPLVNRFTKPDMEASA